MNTAATTESILAFPWEVFEYLSWLRQRPSRREEAQSYLFDEPKVRFAAAESDVLVVDPELKVELGDGRLRLQSPRAARVIELEGPTAADRGHVLELLQLMSGARTLAEVRLLCGARGPLLDTVLEQTFGNFVFAPLALLAAERAVSGLEITRFPASPYEIVRPYWQNMGAVRARVGRLESQLDSDEDFLRELRLLHVIALMGENLQNYYQPQSPISAGRAAPGRLMHTASVVVEGAEVCVFVSGPRVRAALVGGAAYHAALYDSLGDPAALTPRRFVDATGVDWGRIVRAQAAGDPAPEDWFCPPRPIRAAHVTALRQALGSALHAAAGGQRAACLSALADFHQCFVRLHPFHCGNQSLAMNVVNRVLGQLLGAGMPHLMLDHLALRLSKEAYAIAFRRSTEVYIDTSTPLGLRYLRLASTRARTFELTRQLAATGKPTLERAIALDPAAARLLLLVD